MTQDAFGFEQTHRVAPTVNMVPLYAKLLKRGWILEDGHLTQKGAVVLEHALEAESDNPMNSTLWKTMRNKVDKPPQS